MEMGDKSGMAIAAMNIGQAYGVKKNWTKALEFTNRGMQLSKELGYPQNIMNGADILNRIYKGMNNYTMALENYELFILMRDSINNEETKTAAIKSQFKTEYDRKEQVAKMEQEKKDLKNEEEKQQQAIVRNAFVAGFALVLILAVVISRSFLLNKRKNKLIEAQKILVEEKQKEILDSIYYARRIQKTLMPTEKYIEKNLNKLKA